MSTNDPIRTEIAARPVTATLAEVDGRWVLAMTRDLLHPVERVWRKLTEPDQLATWSPVGPSRPLTSVGPATARETPDDPALDAEVLVCDPPRELVHRWGDDVLRWTLTPTASGARLALEHTFDKRDEAGMYGAGWHVCLAVLAVVLDGQQVERIVGDRAREYGWLALRDQYETALSS